MPEFTVKEVRLPELHLPEIKREEIVRSLSGVRLPEVDLTKARRATNKIPAVSLSSSDIGKLVAAGVAAMRLVRPVSSRTSWLTGPFTRRPRSPITRIVQPRRRRSRRPLAVGGILVVVLGAWAVLRRPAVRQRVDEIARVAPARFRELRNGNRGMETHEPVPLASTEMTAGEHPDALGVDPAESSDIPAFEETATHS